jgi:di/tricarboxylate transporter
MRNLPISHFLAILVGLCAAVTFFISDPAGAAPGTMKTAAVMIFTIGFLATVAIPEYLTILIFFFLCLVMTIAPPEIVFSGFISGAAWLVFGGMILGVGIESTGLGHRLAGYIERVCARSYFHLIVGTVFIMFILSVLMPSSVGRVTIMLPIIVALADRLGFDQESKGRCGLILAVGVGALTPSFSILPASVPNVAMAGAAEAIYGIKFTYTEYLFLHFPIIGLLTMMLLPIFIIILFPDKITITKSAPEAKKMSAGEMRLIFILAVSLSLWATDSMHGIAPAWVALGAGIFCALPRFGVLPTVSLLTRMNFGPFLVLAGVIGVGAVVTYSGLGEIMGNHLIRLMGLGKGSDLKTFASVIGLGWVLELMTTLPGQPAIMTAFAKTISESTGWGLNTVLMAQVPAWALVLFPYQAPPLVATRSISGLAVRHFIRLLFPMAVFGWLVMVPLQWLWWSFLGYLS